MRIFLIPAVLFLILYKQAYVFCYDIHDDAEWVVSPKLDPTAATRKPKLLTGIVQVRLLGRTPYVRLIVTRPGYERSFYIYSEQQIELPVGDYTFMTEGGPWRSSRPIFKNIEANQITHIECIMFDRPAIEPQGWFFFDPWVDGGNLFRTREQWGIAGSAEGLGWLGGESIPDGDTNPELCQLISAKQYKFSHNNAIYALWQNEIPSKLPVNAGASLFMVSNLGGFSVIAHPAGFADGTGVWDMLIPHTLAGPIYDAIDVSREEDLQIWLTLLNLGWRIPAVAGGPTANTNDNIPHGRMLVMLPPDGGNSDRLIDSLQKGKSIITTGPLISMTIGSYKIGDTIPTSNETWTLRLAILKSAYNDDQFDRFEIVYNGEIIDSKRFNDSRDDFKVSSVDTQAEYIKQVTLNKPGYILARYYGGVHTAVTQPIWIGNEKKNSRSALVFVRSKNKQGIHVSGRVDVLYGGVVTQKKQFDRQGVFVQAPLLSRLRVISESGKSIEYDICRDTEIGKYLRSLQDSGQLSAALATKEAYIKVEKMLAELSLNVVFPD